MNTVTTSKNKPLSRNGWRNAWRQIKRSKFLYLLFAPVFVYYLIFRYMPMFGIVIAFKDYNIYRGIRASEWVGFEWFRQFFKSMYFGRTLRNTLMINLYDLAFVFPAPIVLALLLNELKNGWFKKAVQTISYLPHFISTVIIVSMFVTFLSPTSGLINNIRSLLGGPRIHFLAEPQYFWGL